MSKLSFQKPMLGWGVSGGTGRESSTREAAEERPPQIGSSSARLSPRMKRILRLRPGPTVISSCHQLLWDATCKSANDYLYAFTKAARRSTTAEIEEDEPTPACSFQSNSEAGVAQPLETDQVLSTAVQVRASRKGASANRLIASPIS